jgi:lysozyme family protein
VRAQIRASASDLEKLLGRKLPQPLTALLPDEVFEGASFLRRLMALEAEAKTLRLPPSILSRGEGSLPLDPDRLYELALPRAVALIDRSEFRNLSFANKAGELLALLHRSQHEVPEAFRTALVLPGTGGPLSLSDQPVSAPGLSLPALGKEVQGAPATPEDPPEPIEVNRSIRFDVIADEYLALYHSATLRSEHQESYDWHLAMIRKAKERYQGVSASTGVPWYFIAIVHGMEASFNFRAHLHNGDFPLSARTRQVPSGRPLRWLPPSDWESSAGDALRLMGFAGVQDWSLPRLFYRLEAFNGFGYRRIGKPTPYLWSFTSNYDRGKYVADGRYNPKARSQQCGGAAMVKVLEAAGEVSFA